MSERRYALASSARRWGAVRRPLAQLSALLGVGVGLLACEGPPPVATLDLESWPSTGLHVATLYFEEGLLTESSGLVPIERFEPARFEVDDAGAPHEAWVLGFETATLATLRQVPDPRTLESSELFEAAPEAWVLPAPDRVLGGSWSEEGLRSADPRDFRLTAPWCAPVDPCELHRLLPHRIVLPGPAPAQVNVVERLDDSRALVFAGGLAYEVTVPEGTVIPQTQLSTSARFRMGRSIGDELYLTGPQTVFARVRLRPSHAFEALPQPRAQAGLQASIDGGETDDGVEVYLWSELGLLERFDGQRWQTAHDFERPVEMGPHTLAWVAPDHVAFVEEFPPTLHVFENGSLRSIPLPAKPRVILFDETFGVLVGTDLASIYRLEGNELKPLPDTPFIGDSIHLLALWGNGLAYAQDDSLGYFERDIGWCIPQKMGGNRSRILSLTPFPSGVLLGTNHGSFPETTIIFAESRGAGRPFCVKPPRD